MEQETKPYAVLNKPSELMYKYCTGYSRAIPIPKLGNFWVFFYSTEG